VERDTLFSLCRSSQEEREWTGRILCGEFTKSHEPSDLTKEKGSYASIPKGSKLRRSRTVDPSHKSHWIYP
jgi:hypothetical protein